MIQSLKRELKWIKEPYLPQRSIDREERHVVEYQKRIVDLEDRIVEARAKVTGILEAHAVALAANKKRKGELEAEIKKLAGKPSGASAVPWENSIGARWTITNRWIGIATSVPWYSDPAFAAMRDEGRMPWKMQYELSIDEQTKSRETYDIFVWTRTGRRLVGGEQVKGRVRAIYRRGRSRHYGPWFVLEVAKVGRDSQGWLTLDGRRP